MPRSQNEEINLNTLLICCGVCKSFVKKIVVNQDYSDRFCDDCKKNRSSEVQVKNDEYIKFMNDPERKKRLDTFVFTTPPSPKSKRQREYEDAELEEVDRKIEEREEFEKYYSNDEDESYEDWLGSEYGDDAGDAYWNNE